MNDISLKRNKNDGEDDDDDIMIIENPNPKPKPPLIILSETSDDDEQQESGDISLNNGLARPVVIEIGSEPEGGPIWSDKTSQSSCTKAASSNINLLADYIPLECSPGLSSTTCSNNEPNGLSSPKATCPECRAELFNMKMLHRHIQFRHPNIYQHSTIPELQNTNCQRNVNTSQQRLKLTPLRSHISTVSVTCGSAITCISNASTCMPIRNNQKSPKVVQLPSLVCRRTGGVSQENQVTATVTTTTSGTSPETMESIDKICQPLKVVIYSPNSQQDRNDRYVQISPLAADKQKDNTKENKTADVIELFDSPCRDPDAVIAVKEATRKNESEKSSCESGRPPCKRKRQDPLLLLVEDDDHEQEISTRPARKKKKDIKEKRIPVNGALTCNVHRKTFSTRSALLQHYQAKHQNDTRTTKETKLNKSYSLRFHTNAAPLPSSTPPSMEKLKTMKHIIMIDIDNWQKIFESDLTFSPSTFVWGFHGGATSWRPPVASSLLKNLKQMNCFYLHPKCGKSKDAADFALCVQAGKLDVLLPKDIIFTVLSGDKGFNELQNQLSLSKREVHIVNPHHKTIETVLTILNSIADR